MDAEAGEKEKVIVMNRMRSDARDGSRLPSPGEIGEDPRPFAPGVASQGRPGGVPPSEPLEGRMPPPRARDRGAGWPEPGRVPEAGEPDYQPPAKKSDPLPRPGDAYRACARFLNRLSTEQRLIHFVDKDGWAEGFAYSDLRRVRWIKGDDPASGPVLVLRFIEAVITDVRVEGRNLEDIHYWISEGVMPWIWEQPAGFKTRDDRAVVITRITFDVKER